MNMKTAFASDYAILESADLWFYYGYEEELDDEWCFVVKKNDHRGEEIFRLKTSELGGDSNGCPEVYLLRGIGKWLETP